MGGNVTVKIEGNLLKVRSRVISKGSKGRNIKHDSRPVPCASASSSVAANVDVADTSVVVTPGGVRLRPPSPVDSTTVYKAMSFELRDVERVHMDVIARLTKECRMQHAINTIGCEAVLVCLKTLDIEVLHDLLALPAVVEYNRRYDVEPTINQLRFNQAQGILISGRGHLSRNCIHAKFFKTMKMQVTGPRSMDELEGVLEYLRGMVAVMLGCDVKIDKPILHNINSGLQLDFKIDRLALTSELLSTMSIRGKPYESTHRQVQYDPEGKKKYAGVRLRVFSGNEKMMPSLMVFHTGYIMIMARSFKLMETAVKYVSKLVSSGMFARTRLVEPVGNDDADKLAEDNIRMLIHMEINGCTPAVAESADDDASAGCPPQMIAAAAVIEPPVPVVPAQMVPVQIPAVPAAADDGLLLHDMFGCDNADDIDNLINSLLDD